MGYFGILLFSYLSAGSERPPRLIPIRSEDALTNGRWTAIYPESPFNSPFGDHTENNGIVKNKGGRA